MRTLCFVLGLLSLIATAACVVFDIVGLQGVYETDLGDGSQWAPLGQLCGLSAVAWMIAAVAYRPALRD